MADDWKDIVGCGPGDTCTAHPGAPAGGAGPGSSRLYCAPEFWLWPGDLPQLESPAGKLFNWQFDHSYQTQHYSTKAGVVMSDNTKRVMGEVADEYYQQTHHDLVVTSGTRTAHEQADAMYNKLHRGENLKKLYANKAALEEVLTSYKTEQTAKSSRAATVDAMTAVIAAQMENGTYISRHLRGGAADVRSRDMSAAQKAAFTHAAAKAGVQEIIEGDHFHLQF